MVFVLSKRLIKYQPVWNYSPLADASSIYSLFPPIILRPFFEVGIQRRLFYWDSSWIELMQVILSCRLGEKDQQDDFNG